MWPRSLEEWLCLTGKASTNLSCSMAIIYQKVRLWWTQHCQIHLGYQFSILDQNQWFRRLTSCEQNPLLKEPVNPLASHHFLNDFRFFLWWKPKNPLKKTIQNHQPPLNTISCLGKSFDQRKPWINWSPRAPAPRRFRHRAQTGVFCCMCLVYIAHHIYV